MPAGGHDHRDHLDARRVHEVIGVRLAAAGQRYTEGRRRLLEVMMGAGRPVSMADLQAAAPELPQSSAYRNLTVLATAGVVHRISSTDDNGYFELSEDIVGSHHHHVMCMDCGGVVDVDASPKLERVLAEAAAIAAEVTGYEIDAHRIDLVGRCPRCRP